MRKGRGHSEEHENGERWLLTYADMITLLMAFFIMMYSMSQLDLKKFDAMTGAVQAQLGGTGILKASMNATQGPELRSGSPGIMPSLSGAPAALQKELEKELRPMVVSSGLKIERTEDGVTLSLPATTLHFASGSAEPTEAMRKAIRRLAQAIKRKGCAVKVTGHTCSLPVRNERYSSNWELSADRARNVAFALIRSGGVSARHCSFMGLADSQPVAPNDTEAHRILNRRVEISLKAAGSGAPAKHPVRSTTQGAVDIRPHLDQTRATNEE